jgi:hypothetical protein
MNTRQQLQFDSLVSCDTVLDRSAFRRDELAALRGRFKQATSEVRKLWYDQGYAHSQRGGDGATLRKLRADLRSRLIRVRRHAVVVLRGLPGIREDLSMPHAGAKDSEQLKAAARILKNLRPHLKTLHDTGLPRGAIADIEAVVKALKAKTASSDTAISRRSRATASLPDAIREARDLARALDAAIRAEISDVTALTIWASSYRIPRKKGRPKKRRQPLPS